MFEYKRIGQSSEAENCISSVLEQPDVQNEGTNMEIIIKKKGKEKGEIRAKKGRRRRRRNI